MKITLINGSPKAKESLSALLTERMRGLLGDEETQLLHIGSGSVSAEALACICCSDILLFAFPLYADAPPSHVLRLLAALEERFRESAPVVYCLINNGFYEGKQCAVAVRQMKLWAKAAGLRFGQAVCIGGGELHRSLGMLSFEHGPNKPVGRALKQLAEHISGKSIAEDVYTEPNCPRFLWNWLGTHFMWIGKAKKNGVKKKEMYRRVTEQQGASS